MHKLSFFAALTAALALTRSSAQAEVWQPSPGHPQVPIWPAAAVPDAASPAKPEGSETVTDSLVAGKPWVAVTDVSQPTMTVYSPQAENTGAAVVIFPGGGYEILAIDLEGTEVADWLTSKGITAIVLKYRVPHSGPYWDDKLGRVYPGKWMALEDAQRTIRLVRHHAAEWHLDPRKIGVLGFSADGHLVASASTRYDETLYAPVDEADKESCRPDFAIALYPGHLWANEDKKPRSTVDEKFELRPDIHVTAQTPPTLLVQGTRDEMDPVEESLTYYIALKRAGVPVEMHLFGQGGHAFGLRRTELPVTRWTELAEAWLGTLDKPSR